MYTCDAISKWLTGIAASTQLVSNVLANNELKVFVTRKAECVSLSCIQSPGPGRHEPLDSRITFPPDSLDDFGAGDSLERGDHLADRQ